MFIGLSIDAILVISVTTAVVVGARQVVALVGAESDSAALERKARVCGESLALRRNLEASLAWVEGNIALDDGQTSLITKRYHDIDSELAQREAALVGVNCGGLALGDFKMTLRQQNPSGHPVNWVYALGYGGGGG